MKIIQLSDIHFSKSKDNSLLKKRDKFFDSLVAECLDQEQVIFTITGDIADRGDKEEYQEIALPFFDGISTKLEEKLPDLKFDFIFIPGNHDCDFSNVQLQEFRNSILPQVKNNITLIENEIYQKNILLQDEFNSFIDLYHGKWRTLKEVYVNPLVKVINCVTNQTEVSFILMNTSWITTIHEKPGEMLFYEKFLNEVKGYLSPINITLLHHPTHWLEPNNKRVIEEIIQSASNIVLSGHEHAKTEVIKTDWNNKNVVYVEGGTLQEHSDPSLSEYNILKFDIEKNQFKVSTMSWNSRMYCLNDRDREMWHPISQEYGTSSTRKLSINSEFEDFLTESAIPLSHPRKDKVNLNDLFVFPDLEEMIYHEENEKQELIETIDIPELISNDTESTLLISGEKDSGKTTLSKIIMQYKLGEGYYPLLINSEVINPTLAHNIEKLIEKSIGEVYSLNDLDIYLQLNTTERILIIEDWHKCVLNDDTKVKFFKRLSQFFSQIIIFADSETPLSPKLVLNVTKEGIRIRRFKVLEFGYQKQEELIEKWVLLGQHETIDRAKLLKEIDIKKHGMAPILRNGFVPKYPLYMLMILSSMESRQPHNLEKSSNGYYFEILIKDSLVNLEIEFNETEKLYQYLTDFAYYLSIHPDNKITLNEWRGFHENHLEHYDMNPDQIPFNPIRNKLINEKVIRFKESCFEFYYPYVFYFFTAQYFARNLHKVEIKEALIDITSNLHVTQNANIIMFLTHLSKEAVIKECVLNAAKDLLNTLPPSKLEDEIQFINNLCTKIIIPKVNADLDAVANRKNVNKSKDDFEKISKRSEGENLPNESHFLEDVEDDEVKQKVIEEVNTANKSFKMLEVIGQILRNYYGSMDREEKIALSTEHYQLGLRLNHWLITQIEEIADMLIEHISDFLSKKNSITQDKSTAFAQQFVYTLASIITHNNLWKIAITAGTEDLDRTFTRIEEKIPTVAVSLINLIIKIEYYKDFPYKELELFVNKNKNNIIVMQIIREVVKRYIYLNDISLSDKQKLCTITGLKISSKFLVKLVNK
ncbi:metallophosphoesterase [Lysinibacillus sp. NPDC056185]|uniref:metallophosphoesterase n=1 Tax=Lysinibacillus sp. NPDC056185 TaxID=3345739 RepID=UPI0039F142CD